MPIVEASAGMAALLIFGTFILFMTTGVPIIFAMGTAAIIYVYLLMGPNTIGLVASRIWDGLDSPVLVALPMFIFMGGMLEKSGVASDLYNLMYQWFGSLKGGLAAGTVFICMIMAAMTGLSAAACLTMGLTALPEMLKRGYNKSMALGCIAAGGALGTLIPPSVQMVMYALVAQASVGQLFMGGVVPGVILGLSFIIYIIIRSWLQPNMGPAIPKQEMLPWSGKLRLLRNLMLPMLIIVMVLGSIYMGIATPTEAAGIGALGTIIAAMVNRKFNWNVLKETCFSSAKICGMAVWFVVGAFSIKSLTFSVGAGQYIEELFKLLPGGIWGILIAMQIIWFFLGCIIDAISIILITTPIFAPIVAHSGMSLVWFGILCICNMEMAYLTPPFGMNLFYLKGVAPPHVTMKDIYVSVWPFVAIQGLNVALVMIFPQIILWLPGKMIQ